MRSSSSSFSGSGSIISSSLPPEISQRNCSKSSSTEKGASQAPVELNPSVFTATPEEAEVELETSDGATESAGLPGCSSGLGRTRKRANQCMTFLKQRDVFCKPALKMVVNPSYPSALRRDCYSINLGLLLESNVSAGTFCSLGIYPRRHSIWGLAKKVPFLSPQALCHLY